MYENGLSLTLHPKVGRLTASFTNRTHLGWHLGLHWSLSMLVFLGFSILLALLLRMQAPLGSAPLIEQLHQICISACPRTAHAPFIAAIVCGERFQHGTEAANYKIAFVKMGLIHLLVVSGSHLICLEHIAKKFGSQTSRRSVKTSVIFFVLAIFTLMTGASPPVLRAFLQWTLSRLATREGWNWTRAQLISVSGFLTMIVCSDRLSLSSLFLSWIAALAIGFLTNRITESFWQKLKSAIYVNASIYLALIPALLPIGVPSLWSLVCNVIFAPMMSLVLFPVSLAGFTFSGFAWLADQTWGCALWLVSHVADRLPTNWDPVEVSTFFLIPYVLILTLWLLFFKERRQWQKRLSAVFALLLCLSAPPARAQTIDFQNELIVWNIGQGAWSTLKSPSLCQHFDIGGEYAPLKQIRTACETKDNEVFYSHWDWDHIGLTRNALKALPNLCVEFSPGGPSPNRGKETLISNLPHCTSPPLAREIFLSRPSHLKLRSANDFSQVFIENRIIFPGDSPSAEEREWSRSPTVRSARILIAGHHGSKSSTSSELLARLPQLKMIIASARKVRYGHPHPLMLARARRAHLPVLITEDWGSLHFELGTLAQRRSAASGEEKEGSKGISKSGTLGISVPSSRRR